MAEMSVKLYSPGMSPQTLAEKVLGDRFGTDMPEIPIDPFKLMREYGIVYQFMGFEELEGIYLVPEDDGDVPVVGINYKRNITRQRFTAAHELCHHLKDRKNELCPIRDTNDEIERFAEQFAAELLMPKKLFLSVAGEYADDGKVSLDDALQIAERFGVSFRSCVLRLAYTFHILDGEYKNLAKRISDYKPDKKKAELGMEIENINLLRQAVDSYEFFFSVEPNIVWYKFKNDSIYNENRMEGLDLDEEEVAEIVTDLRMNRQDSEYCKEEYEDIIQVVGHATLYDYILETDDKLTIYKLLDLNNLEWCEEAKKFWWRMQNRQMIGHFGFSYIGLIFLILLFIPNIIWTRKKPQGYISENENKVLLFFERLGQVLTTVVVLVFNDFNLRSWSNWTWWLIAAFVLMLLYELWWIRYFQSEQNLSDFYRGFLGIPIAGATLPVISFFLLGIYGKVIWLIVATMILGIGHIGIHMQHSKEIKSLS